MDPETLLNCGRTNRRLHRLVCDMEVWRSLLKGIGSFTKERLEELVKFGLGDEHSLEMKAEVLKEAASRFKSQSGSDDPQHYRRFANMKGGSWSSYKLAVSIQGWGSLDTFEMGGEGHLKELIRVAQTVGSKFSIKEVTTYAPLPLGCMLRCGIAGVARPETFHLISGLVGQQGGERLGKLNLHSVLLRYDNQEHDDPFFSLLESSKEWKIQKLDFELCHEYWTALARSASAGHIGTIKFSTRNGKKICKEDFKKVWEIVEKFEVDFAVLIGGGRGEEPKTSWEEAYKTLFNNID